ncbi:hypothetical protein [Ligilactobacillus sp. LYQ60]|uniref:hypothetical protein n=1 Tax=Ligilactobacillus sp. LYQ60 TaxID=3378799 RepID=UPI003851E563
MKNRFKKRYLPYGELPSFNMDGQQNGGVFILWDREKKTFVMARRRHRKINLSAPLHLSSLLAIITVALVPQAATSHLKWGLHWYWFIVFISIAVYLYIDRDLRPQDVTQVVKDNRVFNAYRYNIQHFGQMLVITLACMLGTWFTKNSWVLSLFTYLSVIVCTRFFIYMVTSIIIHTKFVR